MRKRLLPSLVAALLLPMLFLQVSALADDDHEGHHHSGGEDLGNVNFPVSCSASAQATFTRGVALLHSFWYEEAEKAFNSVAQQDKHCAMAHWGVAMSLWHPLWEHPSSDSLKQGWDALKKATSMGAKTDRERDYISALREFYQDSGKLDHATRAGNYANAMEKVYQRNPEDHEAAIFYALALLGAEPEHHVSLEPRKKAAAVLEKVFAEEPNHPGVAHYLIHSYDTPQLAAQGLPAARRYAQIAPAAPHALHMPSHIFSRLGLWQDDINSNLASVAATRKSAAMHMGGAGHQFHAMDFLVYAFLQSGSTGNAKRVIEEMKRTTSEMGQWNDTAAVSQASYALETRDWKAAASLPVYDSTGPLAKAFIYRVRAMGAARKGDRSATLKDVKQIEGLGKSLAGKHKKDSSEDVDFNRREAAAWLAFAEGKPEDAVQQMRAIAEDEEKSGPEANQMPAREMLADMLLETNRPQQALAEYEAALKLTPNRFNGIYGAARAAEQTGNAQLAATYYSQLVKVSDPHSERPELEHARKLLAKN